MKPKLGISILILMFLMQLSMAQNLLYQVYGGSEFRLVHRPDISDSTYQIFFRKNLVWHGTGASGYGYTIATTTRISLVDTCFYKFQPINIQLYQESPPWIVNPILSINPNSGDSASKRIFQVCASTFEDSIVKFVQPGPSYSTAPGNIQPGFKDTFELLRDYWYDTVIHLPEPCGLWQIQDGSLNNSLNPNSCGYAGAYAPFNSNHEYGTNVDTIYSPTYIYGNGSSNGHDVTVKNGISQINTLFPNSSPYFLSYPTAVFVRNVPSFYAMNAVDPDGDSLSFSSINLVFPDSAQGNRPMSHFLPWVPFRQCIDYTTPNFDVTTTCLRNVNYLCPPGSIYPNCNRYDPVYNPFDTDSTFQLNPTTGNITFTAQSAPQSADLFIRCDEYRNGVWVGAVNRLVRFIIVDSMF